MLELGGVSIMLCDLDMERRAEDRLLQELPAAEADYARLIRDPHLRLRRLTRQSFVRSILGKLTGEASQRLRFNRSARGKPYLVPAEDAGGTSGPPPHFSVSHAGNILALAVARDREIGVDIEVPDPALDVLAVAKAIFGADTVCWLTSLLPDERRENFYRHWTQAEAVAKAWGVGIVDASAHRLEADGCVELSNFFTTVGAYPVIGALASLPVHPGARAI